MTYDVVDVIDNSADLESIIKHLIENGDLSSDLFLRIIEKIGEHNQVALTRIIRYAMRIGKNTASLKHLFRFFESRVEIRKLICFLVENNNDDEDTILHLAHKFSGYNNV